MIAVHQDHRPGAPAERGVHQQAPLSPIRDHALDGRGVRLEDGDDLIACDIVAEADGKQRRIRRITQCSVPVL